MSNILIISGSSQADSQSLKVCKYLKSCLNKDSAQAKILDLHKDHLPIFKSQPSKNWQKIETMLDKADSFIWVIPEWNGGANPSIRNMLLHATSKLLGHKPVLLVGVSAGRGGFYPIMEMRASGYKDTKYVIVPENIIINNCNNLLLDQTLNEEAEDYNLKLRINYALSILKLYQQALIKLRNSKTIDHQTYPFGM